MQKKGLATTNLLLTLTLMLLFCVGSIRAEVNRSPISIDLENIETKTIDAASPADIADHPDYECNLKVYMTENKYRWNDGSGDPYEYGFLNYALDVTVTMPYPGGTYSNTFIWDGADGGYGDVTSDNLTAIAVAFNSEEATAYSYPPPPGGEFQTHFVDATAACDVTQNWPNDNTVPGFTHTVFVEEGTRYT